MSFLKNILTLFTSSTEIESNKNGLDQKLEKDKGFYQKALRNSNTIIGAIAGDIIGSVYEFNNTKRTDFQLFSAKTEFTDDSVLTLAIADCILNNKEFAQTLKVYTKKYKHRGYGSTFKSWVYSSDLKPYLSWGNGSAMRVSSVGFSCDSIEKVLNLAKETAEVTHNHPEGIKGAQATAAAIFLARKAYRKEDIKKYISKQFDYDLNKSIDEIRPSYSFDVSCMGSVPQAIRAFLDSTDYENAIRLAISIGGDSDTIACITGGIAAAYYKKVPIEILNPVIDILPLEFLKLIYEFDKRF